LPARLPDSAKRHGFERVMHGERMALPVARGKKADERRCAAGAAAFEGDANPT